MTESVPGVAHGLSPAAPGSDGIANESTDATGLVRGTLATFLAQGVKAFALIGGQIILTRLLSPADFGLIAMVAPVLGFVQVFSDLGLTQAIIQRRDITAHQLSSLFWRTLIVALGLSVALAVSAPLIAWVYREPRTIPITMSLAGVVLVSGVTMQQSALLLRGLRLRALAIVDAVAPSVGVVAGISAAVGGLGVWSLVVVQLAQSLTILVLLWRLSPWRPSRPAIDRSDLDLIKFGGHQAAFNLTQFLTTSLDNVLIGLVNGKLALGYYDRSYSLVVRPTVLLVSPIERLATPLLSRVLDKPENYRSTFSALLQTVIFLVVPGIIFGIFVARPLILHAIGPRWEPIVPIFQWLCLGAIASPIYGCTSWLFVTQGLVARQLRFGVIVAVLNILSFALGVFWGPIGVAVCSALSFTLLQTPLLCWAATREGPVRARDLMKALVPSAAGAAMLVAALATATSRIAGWPMLLGAILASYCLFGLVAGLFPEYRHAVRQSIRLVIRRS